LREIFSVYTSLDDARWFPSFPAISLICSGSSKNGITGITHTKRSGLRYRRRLPSGPKCGAQGYFLFCAAFTLAQRTLWASAILALAVALILLDPLLGPVSVPDPATSQQSSGASKSQGLFIDGLDHLVDAHRQELYQNGPLDSCNCFGLADPESG